MPNDPKTKTSNTSTSTSDMMLVRLLFLASLVSATTICVGLIVTGLLGTPVPTTKILWIGTAVLFGAITVILLLLHGFADSVLPEFPNVVRAWTERRGSESLELWGAGIAVAAAVICVLTSPALCLASVLGLAGFLSLLLVPKEDRRLAPARSLYSPPEPFVEPEVKPTVEPTVEPDQSEAIPSIPVDPWIQKSFAWDVEWAPGEHAPMTLGVNIREARVRSFAEKNPYRETGQPRTPDFGEFVLRGISPEVLEMAAWFKTETERRRWTLYHEVCNVLAFAQAIPYTKDEVSKNLIEYWRYPLETLYDQTGDCEDSSILAASLLRALNHEVVMLDIPGHVAIGVGAADGFPKNMNLVDGRYFFCETTTTGWRVGEIPEHYHGQSINVVPL